MTCRAAIYARSSPDCLLSIEEQGERLTSIACTQGWKVEDVFTDRAAVRVGFDKRPGEVALIDAIRTGTVNRVFVYSICRIGKSLTELVSFMETCRANSVSVYLDQQNIDTAEPSAVSVYELCEMMALHVRQSRRDRILRGQVAARALSIRFGRPPISRRKVERAKQELSAGKGVREAARLAGISAASVSRLKNMVTAAPRPATSTAAGSAKLRSTAPNVSCATRLGTGSVNATQPVVGPATNTEIPSGEAICSRLCRSEAANSHVVAEAGTFSSDR